MTGLYCEMVGMTILPPGDTEYNVYDVREKCTGAMCYPDDHLWQLLNTYEYREAMGLPASDGTYW